MSLTSYSDAYHAGCQDIRRNTSGSTQFLGDKLVSWSSKKQKSTAISSTEAEYIALSRIMNPQETQQVVVRDEKWVPSAERVKISSTNVRLETTMPQKEETFQVVIDIIKNSMTILDICPRVEGVDFTAVPDDDIALTFLIDLGYKGPLNRHTNMFVDHMHQPWRTLAAIINKCLSEKTTNDGIVSRLKFVRIDEDYQEYGLPIPDVMLTDAIKQSEPEPEPAKKKTSSGEAKAARKFHATHAMIANEFVLGSVKKKSSGRSSKNIIQALKESKKTIRRQPGTRGSNEGTSSKPGVPDESTVVSDTSSEGTGAKPGVPDKDKDITEGKDDKDGDVDDEGDDHVRDTQDADDETKSDEDETYKYKIHVRNEEDVEMKDNEVVESDKGEEKVTDIAKEEAEKTLEAIDDTKKTELPSSSSSLFVSSCFGDQFLKLSSDSSLVSIIKDSADTDVISTDVPSPQVTPIFSSIQQTPTPIPTQPITTDALTIITAVHESDAISAVKLRVAKLEKDMSKLKTIDHSSEALVVLQSQVPTIIDSYLDTKVGDVFHKELQKYTADLNHKYSLQHLLELTKKLTPTAEQESEKKYDLKSALYQFMHANKSFNRNPANHRLYHALMEALIKDENAMDKGVADIVKDHKRKHDDDEDPPAGPN
ncbi:hypothetical protein Tco_0846592 [Tanacetum coccineum]